MDNKTDLLVMFLMIIGNINFSIALMLIPVSAPVMVILCVNIFCLLCLLGIYAHKLYDLRKGEKKELNNFMDELVNCPDRVSPPRFKKGDWITNNTDPRLLQIQDVIEKHDETYYHIPYLIAMSKSDMYKATYIDECFRLATSEELHQNGITIDTNE